MSTPAEIIHQLKKLSVYYTKEPLEEQARLYIEALQDLPAHTLDLAVQRHIQESPFFPRISELRLQASRIAGITANPLTEDAYTWLAMSALDSFYLGQMPESELERRFGRILSQTVLTNFQILEQLHILGLARLDECPACQGSGADRSDPTLQTDCPNCNGQGYFRIPLDPALCQM